MGNESSSYVPFGSAGNVEAFNSVYSGASTYDPNDPRMAKKNKANVDFKLFVGTFASHGYICVGGDGQEKKKFFAFGLNSSYQLGFNDTENRVEPTQHELLNALKVEKIALGESHSAFLTGPGNVLTCGKNNHKQCGHSLDIVKIPTNVRVYVDKHGKNVKSKPVVQNIYCGFHTTFLACERKVYACGSNYQNILGTGSLGATKKFTEIPIDDKIVDISAGRFHTLFLNAAGEVYGAGAVHLERENPRVPTKFVPSGYEVGDVQFKQVSCGLNHSFLVTEGGRLFCSFFDRERAESLWDGIFDYFEFIEGVEGIKTLVSGRAHSLLLLEDGGVMGWGRTAVGQLGEVSRSSAASPKKLKISGFRRSNDVIQVYAGAGQSYFVMKKNLLAACGSDLYGNFLEGKGSTENAMRRVGDTFLAQFAPEGLTGDDGDSEDESDEEGGENENLSSMAPPMDQQQQHGGQLSPQKTKGGQRPPAPPPRPGARVNEVFQYRMSETILGEGCYGPVWKGDITSEKREKVTAAIKVVELTRMGMVLRAQNMDPEERARDLEVVRTKVRKDIAILSRLVHPCITRFYGAQAEQNRVVFFTEFMTENTLWKHFGAMDFHERCIVSRNYLKSLLEGLQYCHSKNFNNLNIKPQKILVTKKENGDYACKILPVGVSSKLRDGRLATRRYFAPELVDYLSQVDKFGSSSIYAKQALKKVTPKSDVYSLGLSFLDSLFGEKIRRKFDKRRNVIVPDFENQDEELRGALAQLLKYDPKERSGIKDLLKCGVFPSANSVVSLMDFDFQ